MDYIMDLRKDVGSRPLIMAGACVLVIDEKERLLMQLRRDNEAWGLPGGALELGESLEEAARRELTEETGLIAGELTLFTICSGKEFYYQYPHGDEVYNVTAVYICKEYTGDLKEADEEGAALRFFSREQVPDPINPPNEPIVKEFVHNTIR